MKKKYVFVLLAILLFVIAPVYYGLFSIGTPATKSNAKFIILKTQPFLHEPGKVKMIVFFDFYSPECYSFEKNVLHKLKERFRNKLEVNFVGYPLSPDSYLPIEAYEIAKSLGKGEEMRREIFKAYLNGKDIKNISLILNISRSIGLGKEYELMLNNTKFERTKYNLDFGGAYNIKTLPYVVLDGQVIPTELTEKNMEEVIDYLLRF